METISLTSSESAFKCICSETDSYHVLFSADNKAVCQCNMCGQAYVKGIEHNIVQAEYDESTYFTERNCYLGRREELAGQFQAILNKAKSYVSGGTFLDIGCSVGIFLDVARQNGFSAKGVEVSTWASEFARQKGHDVVTGGLADANYDENCFDIVVMNHVLEHVPAPVEILEEVKRILKDDGLFIVGVPNFGSYMSKLMKEKWFSLMPDQHIWQFTHESLKNLLDKTGFEEVCFEARDNHKIVGWRPVKVLQRLVNCVAMMANNAEAMMIFARKMTHE
jgi:2-polyprenyl-3-methyl-5-hydroxy-6-metoxy-1,4-benzoquinol methylase